MKLFIIALGTIFLCLNAGATTAQSLPDIDTRCGGSKLVWADWQSQMLAHNPSAHLQRVPEAKRVSFLSMYNSLPPVTDYNPNLIVFLHIPPRHSGLLIFVERGCVILMDVVPVQTMRGYLPETFEPANWRAA